MNVLEPLVDILASPAAMAAATAIQIVSTAYVGYCRFKKDNVIDEQKTLIEMDGAHQESVQEIEKVREEFDRKMAEKKAHHEELLFEARCVKFRVKNGMKHAIAQMEKDHLIELEKMENELTEKLNCLKQEEYEKRKTMQDKLNKEKKELMEKHKAELAEKSKELEEMERKNEEIVQQKIKEVEKTKIEIEKDREHVQNAFNRKMEELRKEHVKQVEQLQEEIRSLQETNSAEMIDYVQQEHRCIINQFHQATVLGVVHHKDSEALQLGNQLDVLYSKILQIGKHVKTSYGIITASSSSFTLEKPANEAERESLKTELDELEMLTNSFDEDILSLRVHLRNSGADDEYKNSIEEYFTEITKSFGLELMKHSQKLKNACENGIIEEKRETTLFIEQFHVDLKRPVPSPRCQLSQLLDRALNL